MAVTISTDRKSAVNTDRFAIAPITADSGTALTYGAVTEIVKAVISVKTTPKMNAASQYASGQQVDSSVSKSGGTLDVTVPALNAADETLLFGAVMDETTYVISSNKDDVIPDVMTIWSTKRSDGTINLYKAMKAKYKNQGETVETSDDSGIKYQATALQAEYVPLIKTGDDLCFIKGLDVSTAEGQAVETAWFATALGGLPVETYPIT